MTRNITILIALTMLSYLGYGQSAFNTMFDYEGNYDVGTHVVEQDDGSFLALGLTMDAAFTYQHLLLVKYSCDGDTLWTNEIQVSLQDNKADFPRGIIENNDGTLILLASAYDSTSTYTKVFLLKITTTGNVLWYKYYDNGGENGEDARDFKRTPDGGFIITGWTNNNTLGLSDVYVIKTDSVGNIEWENNLGGTDVEEPTAIDLATDGGYIISGKTRSFGGAGSYELYLLKIDSLGAYEWHEIYGSGGADAGKDVLTTLDGGFIMAGITVSGGGDSDAIIIKTDASGGLEWSKQIGGVGSAEGFEQVVQLQDSSFATVGIENYGGATGIDAQLMKLDKNGDTVWSKSWGGVSEDYFWGFNTTSDNGYILTGRFTILGPPYYAYWTIKTDSLGCDTCSLDCIACDFIVPLASVGNDTVWVADSGDVQFTASADVANDWFWDFGDGAYSYEQNPLHTFTDSGTYTVTMYASFGSCTDTVTLNVVVVDTLTGIYEFADKPELRMYPNPTSGNVTFFSTEKGNGVIYDIAGKLVHQFGIEEKNTTFDASSLNAGIYLVRFTSSNGSSSIANLVVNTGF